MYRRYQNSYEIQAEEINARARMEARLETENRRKPEDSRQESRYPPAGRGSLIIPESPRKADGVANFLDGILNRFAADDIILLALIFLLLTEKNNDKLLLIILGYLFITGL